MKTGREKARAVPVRDGSERSDAEGVHLPEPLSFQPLRFHEAVGWIVLAWLAFHAAYLVPWLSALMLLYPVALWELSRVRTVRWAFRAGVLLGLGIFSPHLLFFWAIFGVTAVMLWLILAFWVALFVAVARAARGILGPWPAAVLAPFVWIGTEYFRSELYYLRFSWVNIGYGFPELLPGWVFQLLGGFGIGFLLMAAACGSSLLGGKNRLRVLAGCFLLLLILNLVPASEERSSGPPNLRLAGVQMEFPSESKVIKALDDLQANQPDTDLFVLSEYTFSRPVPDSVREWCRKHAKHVAVGAKEPVGTTNYFNTVFVLGPDGSTVFQQAKCVPIQFFNDGLPAKEQSVWESPWGRIGFGICYDFSYTRVTDELIRQGAQLLIVPTMDVIEWGGYQHRLHSRVTPVRAAEYGVPVFRLCSSGISQSVAATGRVRTTAPFPGQHERIVDGLALADPGSLPADRWLAPLGVGVTVLALIGLPILRFRQWRQLKLPGS